MLCLGGGAGDAGERWPNSHNCGSWQVDGGECGEHRVRHGRDFHQHHQRVGRAAGAGFSVGFYGEGSVYGC
eukprot:168292-Prorocentrum_minimum.AAC.3